MGIVFVLLLGEIDLSVGFVSGVAGVIDGAADLPDDRNVFAAGPAIVVALAAGVGDRHCCTGCSSRSRRSRRSW